MPLSCIVARVEACRMAARESGIESVADPCPVNPRRIGPQNVVVRLRRRETMGCPYPGTHVHCARQFYQNVFPNFTVMNVEKPPCFLRKFSPDGRYLVAFSADQTSIEVYEYRGAPAAADLLADCEGEYIGHKSDDCSFHIRSNIFARFFKVLDTNRLPRGVRLYFADCKDFKEKRERERMKERTGEIGVPALKRICR